MFIKKSYNMLLQSAENHRKSCKYQWRVLTSTFVPLQIVRYGVQGLSPGPLESIVWWCMDMPRWNQVSARRSGRSEPGARSFWVHGPTYRFQRSWGQSLDSIPHYYPPGKKAITFFLLKKYKSILSQGFLVTPTVNGEATKTAMYWQSPQISIGKSLYMY